MRKLTNIAAVLALGLFGAAFASAQAPPPPPQVQPQGQGQPSADPGVARVSFIHGDVSVQRGDSGDVSVATLNEPLMAGDKIVTGNDARAELQLDYANILRMDANAQANIATLANNRIQVQVGQGMASYSALKNSQADVEIDTPNVAVRPLRDGRYRVYVDPNGDSEITVREGQAEVSTSEGSTKVNKGQLITVHGTSSQAQYKVIDADGSDPFDVWNADRDQIILNAEGARRTNPYYTGAGDLDGNGVWSEMPDYGPVWTPTVDVGWAPYRDGRWVWEPYWGWTWVSYESWGWAPYHYGRWFLNGSRWAWWPGPVYGGYRPIWAPAYVSFLGFGGGVGLGVGLGFGWGFGSIGWLPIGPGDYFHPWWGGFRERFNAVDIHGAFNNHDGFAPLHGGGRFSNLRDVETNDRLRGGVSGVRSEAFGRGGEAPHGISAQEFSQGRMMTGNLPVVPGRESLRASDRPVNSTVAARAGSQQRFFTRNAPTGSRESFSDQASRVQTAIQRTGSFRAIGGGVNPGGAGASPSLRPQGQVSQGQAAEGWNRFGGGRPQSGQPQVQGQNGGQQFNGRGGQPATRFEQQGRPEQPNGQSQGGQRSNEQASPGWQRFNQSQSQSQSQSPRAESAPRGNEAQPNGNFRGGQPSYRPPLDMSKPVVNPRSTGGGSGGSTPQYRGAPSYSAPAQRSAPSYRSAPSGNSGGGGYRGGGGGGSRGGGGGGARSGGGGGGHHR